jgi:hypothetical protein
VKPKGEGPTLPFSYLPWWWNGRHEGLKNNLSALSEKRDVECRKFKEALTGHADGNLEPSLQKKEGAETRHDTPKDIPSMVKE